MVVPDYRNWAETYQQKLAEATRVNGARVKEAEPS
jgi:hypothetical protein